MQVQAGKESGACLITYCVAIIAADQEKETEVEPKKNKKDQNNLIHFNIGPLLCIVWVYFILKDFDDCLHRNNKHYQLRSTSIIITKKINKK